MAEAADAARVSRATAYRYFPTQEALQVELDFEQGECANRENRGKKWKPVFRERARASMRNADAGMRSFT